MLDRDIDGTMRKVPTAMPGFDLIAGDGLTQGRTTLVSGNAGSTKTVMAVQFLAAGLVRYGAPGVFITFAEPPGDSRRNMLGFGWHFATWGA